MMRKDNKDYKDDKNNKVVDNNMNKHKFISQIIFN